MALRKNPKADLRKWYSTYVQIGLVLSLLLLVLAFRANFDRGETMVIEQIEQETIQMDEILQTEQIKKPPPPPPPPVPVEVPNDEVLEDFDLDLDAALDIDEPLTNLPPPPPVEEKEEEPEPEIFTVVEQLPEIIGGMAALQSSIKYPEIAQKAGVEGKVFVSFVVDENGDVHNPTVARPLGAGCDEAALEAISKAKFRPGRQRGKAVKVRMTIPVTFKLQ